MNNNELEEYFKKLHQQERNRRLIQTVIGIIAFLGGAYLVGDTKLFLAIFLIAWGVKLG